MLSAVREGRGRWAVIVSALMVLLTSAGASFAAQETQALSQPQQRDAAGRMIVEAASIHVITCNGPGENGGQYYIYQYLNRAGFRAILPPDWGHALGGRDFPTLGEAVREACSGRRMAPVQPPQTGPGYVGPHTGARRPTPAYPSPQPAT